MRTNKGTYWFTGALVAAFFGLVLMSGAAVAARSADSSVMKTQSNPHGASYAEWAARWWQWAFSIPVHDADGNILHPLFDETGDQAAVGQSGNVWFLGGVFNASGTVERDITIPSGTSLFFPVINAECSTLEAPPFYGGTEDELQECVSAINMSGMTAELNGRPIGDLERFKVLTAAFPFTLPDDNFLGLPAGSSGQAADQGVYLMLKPLPVGEHTLHFGGTFPDFGFTLDITYNITVVPRGRYEAP